MLTSINRERSQVVTERGGRVVNGEPSRPCAIGQGQLRVTQTLLTRSALASVFLWLVELIRRLEPMHRVNSLKSALVNLGS